MKKHDLCRNMWFENITFLDLTLKGLIIGIVASAPMGPVGVLCVQRTLNKGRWFGFVTGIGAAISDIFYACATGFGMSFVMDFIKDSRTMWWMQMIGSIMLFAFGIYTYKTKPHLRLGAKRPGTMMHNGVTGFFVTLSNPLIIFLFMAMFARFTFVVPEHLPEQILGYFSIFLGALAWWFGLTYLIDKIRTNFDAEKIWLINRIIGVVVMIASFLGFLSTLLGLSFYQ